MSKVLKMVAGLTLAGVTSQAAITWGPWAETVLTLGGSAFWDGTVDPETSSVMSPAKNWSVSLTFGSTAKSYSVVLDGTHLVGPHPGDSSPGDTIELGALFTKATGKGTADGTILHNPPPGSGPGHTDTWHLDAVSTATGVDASFTAVHSGVPEPSTYALVAGLGLVGFAAFRRLKA